MDLLVTILILIILAIIILTIVTLIFKLNSTNITGNKIPKCQSINEETLYFVSLDYCPHCSAFEGQWEELKGHLMGQIDKANTRNIRMIKINNTNKNDNEDARLQTYLLLGNGLKKYPIILFKDGNGTLHMYSSKVNGKRTSANVINWLNNLTN